MTTLATALLDLARKVTSALEGTATGGSTTTLVDSALVVADNHYKHGTIWFLSGNNAGKTAIISEFLAGTFTFPTQSGACAANDRYAAAPPDFPKWRLVQAINEAMKDLTAPATNETLTVVADQESYTLPAGVSNLLRVEIASNSASPYGYQKSYAWYEQDGKLKFDAGFEPAVADRLIRLTYIPQHTEIYTDASTISNLVNQDHLSWKAAVHALRWRVNKTREDEPERVRQLNEALAMAERLAGAHPMPEKARDPHLAGW